MSQVQITDEMLYLNITFYTNRTQDVHAVGYKAPLRCGATTVVFVFTSRI